MERAFNTNVAVQYDVNIAVLLQYFKYYTGKPQNNPEHIHDDLFWIRSTIQEINELFIYWSRKQIQNIINKAVKSGLLVKGNYNKNKHDRTIWYALTPKANELFGDVK